jgi:hypothetical protein
MTGESLIRQFLHRADMRTGNKQPGTSTGKSPGNGAAQGTACAEYDRIFVLEHHWKIFKYWKDLAKD